MDLRIKKTVNPVTKIVEEIPELASDLMLHVHVAFVQRLFWWANFWEVLFSEGLTVNSL